MTDPTRPFFGNPKETRRANRARQNLAKTYEDTWLDSFIKGMFGEEEPSGSVLEEKRDKKQAASTLGQAFGVGSDLIGSKALLTAPLAAAIRLKGAKDLLATHVTKSPREVASSGFLDAPSVGITSRRGSDFAAADLLDPQMIFSAGKLDPERLSYPTTFINRDAYIGSPSGRNEKGEWSEDKFQRLFRERTQEFRQRHGEKWPDLRMAHSFPGEPSQILAVAASPNFRSLLEFEKSPYGAAVLRNKAGPRRRRHEWEELEREIAELAAQTGDNPRELAKIMSRHMYENDFKASPEWMNLWERAKSSPSNMAELKLHGKVPISPADTAVFAGGVGHLDSLTGFRDAGFPVFTQWHLGAEPGRVMGQGLSKLLPRVAGPQGGFKLPPDLTLKGSYSSGAPDVYQAEKWNDWINPRAGGSPPLSKALVRQEHDIIEDSPNDPFGMAQWDDPWGAWKPTKVKGPQDITTLDEASEFLLSKPADEALDLVNEWHAHGMITDQEHAAWGKLVVDKAPSKTDIGAIAAHAKAAKIKTKEPNLFLEGGKVSSMTLEELLAAPTYVEASNHVHKWYDQGLIDWDQFNAVLGKLVKNY